MGMGKTIYLTKTLLLLKQPKIMNKQTPYRIVGTHTKSKAIFFFCYFLSILNKK